jgi:predicted nucleic acid-binding protein
MPLPSRLFCDASFFYACLDPHDVNHARARALAEEAAAAQSVLYATWDVVAEAATLLRYRLGPRPALAFLAEVKPALRLVSYGDRVRSEAEELFRHYTGDRRLSFCDAVSFVVVTTLLDQVPCLAFDADFRALGLTVIG